MSTSRQPAAPMYQCASPSTPGPLMLLAQSSAIANETPAFRPDSSGDSAPRPSTRVSTNATANRPSAIATRSGWSDDDIEQHAVDGGAGRRPRSRAARCSGRGSGITRAPPRRRRRSRRAWSRTPARTGRTSVPSPSAVCRSTAPLTRLIRSMIDTRRPRRSEATFDGSNPRPSSSTCTQTAPSGAALDEHGPRHLGAAGVLDAVRHRLHGRRRRSRPRRSPARSGRGRPASRTRSRRRPRRRPPGCGRAAPRPGPSGRRRRRRSRGTARPWCARPCARRGACASGVWAPRGGEERGEHGVVHERVGAHPLALGRLVDLRVGVAAERRALRGVDVAGRAAHGADDEQQRDADLGRGGGVEQRGRRATRRRRRRQALGGDGRPRRPARSRRRSASARRRRRARTATPASANSHGVRVAVVGAADRQRPERERAEVDDADGAEHGPGPLVQQRGQAADARSSRRRRPRASG